MRNNMKNIMSNTLKKIMSTVQGKNIRMMSVMLFAVLILSACGGGKDIETTAAQVQDAKNGAEALAEQAAGQEDNGEEEEVSLDELQYFEGIVTAFDAKTMTVASDDGATESFDISGASDDDENDEKLICGCYVEIGYTTKDSATGLCKASYITILSGMEEECDNIDVNPYMKGSVTFFDDNTVTIRDLYGDEYEFICNIARYIGFDAMKEGSDVTVTYYGSVFDTEDGLPVAFKIIEDDALGTEEAKDDIIVGTISSIDGANATLETEVMTLGLWGDEEVFSKVREEVPVNVYISGAIRNDSVECVKIEPAD